MASLLTAFEYQPRTRIVFGPNSIDRLGELARAAGIRRPLIVTDAGIVAAGHVARAGEALAGAGLEAPVFDRVRENPTTADVDHCREFARDTRIDGLIGLGGGSSLDTAKGCNFLLTNGGRMQDYRGYGKAARPMLPLIAVPTTAGTGSECQSYALIADEETHQKMACGDPKAAAAVALLDPQLTLSQPRRVTACTGLDAMAHAVETSVTLARTPLSLLYSREAFRLTANHLQRVLEVPDDLEARAAMQLGAAYGGLAIENSMLGAAHAAANPLTAHFGVAHGQAVGIMLPHVVRFNSAQPAACEAYRDLAISAGLVDPRATASEAVPALIVRLEHLLSASGLPAALTAEGLDSRTVRSLAMEAAEQWTADFNPRTITAPDFVALYEAALADPTAPVARQSDQVGAGAHR
jgi:alcohol dehydrogenase